MSLRCSSTVCWPELVGFVLLGIICCSLGASAKFQRRFSSYFPQGPLEYLAENIYGDCTMSGNDSSDITFRVLEPNKSEIIAWHSSLAPKTLTSPLHCHSLGNRTCTRLQSVHPYSPRCDKILVSKACQSSSLQATVLPEALSSRKNTNGYMFPYLLYLKDGIVLSCGGVATKCGGLSRSLSCGTIPDKSSWSLYRQCHDNPKLPSCQHESYRQFDRVVVFSYKFDSGFGHFLLEVFPRLVYFLDILQHPQTAIHFGCDKKFSVFPPILKYFKFLGISPDRLIQGNVHAKDIIIPREGACQDMMWNNWEYLTMKRYMFTRCHSETINLVPPKVFHNSESKSEYYITVVRRSNSRYSSHKSDLSRIWSANFTSDLMNSLSRLFPQFSVHLFSDQDTDMMDCICCSVSLFAKSAMVIGMHGAGLSHIAFMPPGSLAVEMSIVTDGRMLPSAGPFSRLAMTAGVHHYLYRIEPSQMTIDHHHFEFSISSFTADLRRAIPLFYDNI